MSQEVEKKYRVESFAATLSAIERIGAQPTISISSTHYYARLDTDDTLKMVDYGNKIEIHTLSTTGGLHTLNQVIPVDSIEAGFAWFKQRGHTVLEALSMHDSEYSFGEGGFALYTVDNAVYSVILGYLEESLQQMEATLGLESAEIIDIPYNKYMARLGILRTISVNQNV